MIIIVMIIVVRTTTMIRILVCTLIIVAIIKAIRIIAIGIEGLNWRRSWLRLATTKEAERIEDIRRIKANRISPIRSRSQNTHESEDTEDRNSCIFISNHCFKHYIWSITRLSIYTLTTFSC